MILDQPFTDLHLLASYYGSDFDVRLDFVYLMVCVEFSRKSNIQFSLKASSLIARLIYHYNAIIFQFKLNLHFICFQVK